MRRRIVLPQHKAQRIATLDAERDLLIARTQAMLTAYRSCAGYSESNDTALHFVLKDNYIDYTVGDLVEHIDWPGITLLVVGFRFSRRTKQVVEENGHESFVTFGSMERPNQALRLDAIKPLKRKTVSYFEFYTNVCLPDAPSVLRNYPVNSLYKSQQRRDFI